MCSYFPSSRHTPPVASTSPSISSAYTGAGLRRKSSIWLRIFRNGSLGTATPAITSLGTDIPCFRYKPLPVPKTNGFGTQEAGHGYPDCPFLLHPTAPPARGARPPLYLRSRWSRETGNRRVARLVCYGRPCTGAGCRNTPVGRDFAVRDGMIDTPGGVPRDIQTRLRLANAPARRSPRRLHEQEGCDRNTRDQCLG